MALDLGKKRIGLAITDELGITAQPLETLHRTRIRDDIAYLTELIGSRNVSLLLIGNPLHMSGHESRQSEYTRDFAQRLSKASGIPVHFWDERLTSVEAERILKEGGLKIRRSSGDIDRMAAMILLEAYLDSLHL